jgi:hypothetical protein
LIIDLFVDGEDAMMAQAMSQDVPFPVLVHIAALNTTISKDSKY